MWFSGSVPEAIAKSKSESKLFIVLIYGDDEVSTRVKSSIESHSESFAENSVAICLESKSEHAALFSQIYPYSIVPSFFIIHSGKAVVVESGDIDVKSVVEKMASLGRGGSESAASPAASPAAPSTSPGAEHRGSGESSSPSSSPTNLSLPEKIALTKKKLQEAQKKREAEEREREKQQRESGRELLKAQRTREEKEYEQAAAERKRDQQLDKEHRARVLAQIALDSEERKRKFGAITPSNKAGATGATPCKQTFNFNSDETRIQFKFPDGHNVAQVFASSEKFEAALKFIEDQETSYRSFSLSTAFPRRVFTESDFSSSFSDLGLVPSSTLLIIPKSGHSGSNYPYVSGAVSSMSPSSLFSSLIMAPLLQIWSFISSLIWGSTSSNTSSTAPGDTDSSPAASSSPLTNRSRKSSPGARRRSGSGGSTVIHRLHRDNSKDDDNNTWNGNSTQQM